MRPTSSTAAIRNLVDDYLAPDGTDRSRNLRALVITVGGETVVERYLDSGTQRTWDVQSVGKSVMSMLVGIALDEGRLQGVDQTLGELLPTYAAVMAPGLEEVTLHQLLTMTAGLPPDPPTSPESEDWVAEILSRGTSRPPGQGFTYSSAGSHLLSAILVQATGQSVLDYARAKLFDPLGVDSRPAAEPVAIPQNLPEYERAGFAWPTDPQGLHLGMGSIKMTTADMVKLGQLMLRRGRWDDRQVLPESWVDESTRAHVRTNGPIDHGYGYQWWVPAADGHAAYAAFGHGGQLLEVVPDLDLVVAVSSVVTDEPGVADADTYAAFVGAVIVPALAK